MALYKGEKNVWSILCSIHYDDVPSISYSAIPFYLLLWLGSLEFYTSPGKPVAPDSAASLN